MATAALSFAAGTGGGAIRTAIVDPLTFTGPDQDLAFQRTARSGASTVRLLLQWKDVSPANRPATWDARNSADPHYAQTSWLAFDRQVKLAVAHGLEPLIYIFGAPRWAERSGRGNPGTRRPSPRAYADFARAAVKRYGGSFPDPTAPLTNLPRVRYWQSWNEPNRSYFLYPQYVRHRLYAPVWYRRMTNKFYAAVHGTPVVPSTTRNLVVAGGLAPFGRGGTRPSGQPAPLAFMRKMLCLSRRNTPVCRSVSRFDIWSTHPYTCGPPSRHARGRDDVSVGDLPEMRRVLRAAIRRHRVRSSQRVAFWVTEFGWDTSPPDPRGVPMALHARWVAESLYRMSRAGVSLVTWFKLQDEPYPASAYQSGFYPAGALPRVGPKFTSLEAFRFPFVAFGRRTGVLVWGRTPPGASHSVVIERKVLTGWVPVGNLTSSSGGSFSHTYSIPRTGPLRARITGAAPETSVPFSLTVPAQPLICPFG